MSLRSRWVESISHGGLAALGADGAFSCAERISGSIDLASDLFDLEDFAVNEPSEACDSLKILVVGDVNLDTIIVHPVHENESGEEREHWQTYNLRIRKAGGTWFLRNVIKAAIWGRDQVSAAPSQAASILSWPIKQRGLSAGAVLVTYSDEKLKEWKKQIEPPCLVSIRLLAAFRKKNRGFSYRIKDTDSNGYLYSGGDCSGNQPSWRRQFEPDLLNLIRELQVACRNQSILPQILVINDENNGFRDLRPAESVLPLLDGNPHFSRFGMPQRTGTESSSGRCPIPWQQANYGTRSKVVMPNKSSWS